MADTERSTPASPRGAGREASPASANSPAPAPMPLNTEVLEADPDVGPDESENDNDSSLSLHGGVSDTTSVASSVFKFREENGRTYHSFKRAESAYFLPNDERENERLDLQHNMILRLQGNQLFLCPAGKDKPLKRVLDCGTGTGIWAMDFADEHPETSVVGVDLSPIQPTFVPPNVEFYVDDLEADWTFVNKFDFIYSRMMIGSIRDWPRYIGQAYEHLRPGGYFEICDGINPIRSDDGSFEKTKAASKWINLLVEASRKHGSPLDAANNYKKWMIEAGFVDITEVRYKWPINSWPKDPLYKEIGEWNLVNFLTGLQGFTLMLYTHVLGWSVSEIEALLVDVRKEMKSREVHGYWPVYVIYGRKPE